MGGPEWEWYETTTYVVETPAAKVLKYELEIASLKKTVSGLRVLLEASERTTAKQARHIRELEQVLVGKLLKEQKLESAVIDKGEASEKTV